MTLTDIANIALEDIGAKAISSIDGDDVLARKIKRRLPITISEVSNKRNWSCLLKTILCSRVEGISFDGRNLFNKPNGLLKIVAPALVSVEGDYIVHHNENLKIQASIISENPDEWDENLRGAILSQLKADIAFMATGDIQLTGQLKQIAEREIQHYIRNDFYKSKGKRPKQRILAEGHFVE